MKRAIPLVLAALVAGPLSGCGDDAEPESSAPVQTTAMVSTSSTTSTTTTITTLSPREVDTTAVTAFLEQQIAAVGADGGMVAVRFGDGERTVVTAGVTDQPSGTPLPADGSIYVASITKSFVGAILLDLAGEGLVGLDDPISRYVEWPGGDAISVRQLLQHESGIGPWGNATDTATRYRDTILADVAANHLLVDVVTLLQDIPPIGGPGTQTYYSNLNYIIAGRIAEVVSGRSFAELLQERIVEPLGLTSTYYPVGEAPTSGATPLPGLFEFEEGVILPTTQFPASGLLSLLGPSAATVSTIDDLMTWGDAVLRDRRIGELDVSAMTELTTGGYGLGVLGVDRGSGSCVFDGCPRDAIFEIYGLNGELPGSSTRLWYEPETETMLFVYLNRDGGALDDPMIELLDLLAT